MNNMVEEAIMHFKEAVETKNGPIKFAYTISINDVELLLDYITNLQKENEDYKSRVKKAVEYIKKDLSLGVNTFGSVYSIGANEVLNILQNGSENNE